MSFRQTVKERRWFVSGDGQTTHLLMDGSGKLCVPDSQAGLFLNIYFAAAIVKGEPLSVVERKSPIFRLFFDLDIRVAEGVDHTAIIRRLSVSIWRFVSRDFFILESTGTSIESSESSTSASARDRMIVCTAPLKVESPGVVKAGCHLIFPNIFVNSPIALKCRAALLEAIESMYTSIPCSTSAQSVTQCRCDSDDDEPIDTPGCPVNSWSDVVDDSVYRGSGLRMVWSHKGRHEARVYTPVFEMESVHGWTDIQCDSLATKREYVHDCSIRTTVGFLTPCRGGEHQIADNPNSHSVGGASISGRSHSVDVYAEALPVIEKALPDMYRGIRFLKAFATANTIYLKTNSRYCMNVKREHRTSTVYLAITRHGMMIRCYSRKDEYRCSEFATPVIPLPKQTLSVFFPDTFQDLAVISNPLLQSTKRRRTTGSSVLDKSPLFTKM
jgi:hypothetical protein